jgi:hypothetical protein
VLGPTTVNAVVSRGATTLRESISTTHLGGSLAAILGVRFNVKRNILAGIIRHLSFLSCRCPFRGFFIAAFPA